MSAATLSERRNDVVDITAVGDADSDANPVVGRRTARLVDDLAVADDAVGHRDFDIVTRQDARAAQANLRDDDRVRRFRE